MYFFALACVSAKYLAYSSPTIGLSARPSASSFSFVLGVVHRLQERSRSLQMSAGMPFGPAMPRVEFEITVG